MADLQRRNGDFTSVVRQNYFLHNLEMFRSVATTSNDYIPVEKVFCLKV